MNLRKACFATLTVGLLGAPLSADAQPAAKVARIGVLSTVNPRRSTPWFVAFDQRLN